MKIREIRALRGPNYYATRPVIFLELDIGELEEKPTDMVPEFKENLMSMLPSIYEHTCSPGVPGGFLQRIQRGTWAGHVVEHIAIELQSLLGHEVTFGKTFTQKEKGVYHVVYRYISEETGIRAGELAVEIVDKLFRNETTDIGPIIEELAKIEEENELGPSTRSIVNAAKNRGISHIRLNENSYVQLGEGKYQRRIEATITDQTSSIGVEIACDKYRTKKILKEHGIPVPVGIEVCSFEEGLKACDDIGYPVVTKPLDGNHGRGITTNIINTEELKNGLEIAQDISNTVVIEKMLEGFDYRVIVIDGKFQAAALRKPAQVIGDGISTIKELIEKTNEDISRGEGHERILTKIKINHETERVLELKGLNLDSIIEKDEVAVVKATANLSTGGTAEDVTDSVHTENIKIFERVAKIIGLDIIGIDLVAKDLKNPLNPSFEGIVEVNAAPGFRMHLNPSKGKSRNIAEPVIDMLFPENSKHQVPICAVTGTNGKTTTTRLIAHIMSETGHTVGLTSTDGIEIDGTTILKGDYSGPGGAQGVMMDPTVDLAVLEVARGGIIRRGLGFSRCDVGVLLNVSSDHLGYGGIDTLQEMARLKSTVTEVVSKEGYAVFNGEDELVLDVISRTKGRPVLFSKNPENKNLKKYLNNDNYYVTVIDDEITIVKEDEFIKVTNVKDIPICFKGKASFNIENALAAVAATYGMGADISTIDKGLRTFNESKDQSPGRMHIVEKEGVKIIVDYGHNIGAVHATGEFIKNLSHGRKIRMSAGVGNRRNEDIVAYGEALAKYFDTVVLCDSSPRGRDPLETANLVKKGLLKGGVKEDQITTVLTEKEATEIALKMAKPGDVVLLQAENIKEVTKDALNYTRKS